MKNILWILFLAIVSSLRGQMVTGIITDISGSPISDVAVFWKSSPNQIVLCDSMGQFQIMLEADSILIFSHPGYLEDRLLIRKASHWKIQLMDSGQLKEVNIKAKSSSTKFLDNVEKVEAINVREIQRAACCSLAGCFSTNSNVEANTTNIITDAKELRILGLSGVYNQTLVDGMPLIQGLSFPYGPGSYSGTMIEKIYVTKGANSVLQGFESISGQINMEFFSPKTAPVLFANAFINSFGESQYNLNHVIEKKNWGNFTTAHLTKPAKIIDRDGDGFRDIVQTNRVSFFNKWSYESTSGKFSTSIGMRYLNEQREGGINNYNFKEHKGSDKIYGQHTDINHTEVYTKTNITLNDKLGLVLLNSCFKQKQSSVFGIRAYNGNQLNLYQSTYLDYYFGTKTNNIKAGISYRYNDFDEKITNFNINSFSNDFSIPGFFAETKLNLGKTTILAGLRYDKISNWKLTPRLLIRNKLSENTDLRLSIGKGHRLASLFAENPILLSSNRRVEINGTLDAEEAVNTGINFTHSVFLSEKKLTISADAYFTFFQNQIFPDYDSKANTAIIQNFKGKSKSHSYQVETKMEFSQNFDFKIAYNYLDVSRHVNGKSTSLPFVSKHSFIANTSYNSSEDKYQFDCTYRWHGPKRLPSTEKYPSNYIAPTYGEAYGQIDFQFTRRWSSIEIYTGMENIFDFRQKFPILGYENPFGEYFDPSFNWGPTKGRELYLGLRWYFKKK